MFASLPIYDSKKVVKKNILKKKDRELLRKGVYYLSIIAHALDKSVPAMEKEYDEDEINIAKMLALRNIIEEYEEKKDGQD